MQLSEALSARRSCRDYAPDPIDPDLLERVLSAGLRGPTAGNSWGLDLVVEGSARPVGDEAELRRIAEAFVAKYGEEWRYEVRDGAFRNRLDQRALVYRLRPSVAFGFRKGDYAQTRWRF